MNEYKFSKSYNILNLQQDAKKKLIKFSEELKIVLQAFNIKGEIEENHHMTLSYNQDITAFEILEILVIDDKIRKELENIELLDPHKKYDQSIHQMEIWESFKDKSIHIVLTPHNKDSVYKKLKKGNSKPHINLAKLECDLERAQEILPQIKNIFRKYIQDRGIAVDFSEIITHSE